MLTPLFYITLTHPVYYGLSLLLSLSAAEPPPLHTITPTIRHMRVAVINYKEVDLAILQNLLRFVGNSAF